ncbi:MAG: DoxX family membrane protein [Bacteroidota bacterium]
MKTLTLTGRIMYGLPFAIFGIFHFMNTQGMTGLVPGFLPGAKFWVYLTGIAFLLAAISLFINKFTRIAMILFGIMLLIFVLTVHIPGLMNAENQQAQMMAMTSLLKDTALSGAAFFIAGHYSGSRRSY